MQTEQVRKRSETDGTYENSNEPIAFSIYHIKDKNFNVKLLNNQKFFDHEVTKMGSSGVYMQQREVTKRFELPPGNYIIIPSMYRKNKRMKFMMRVYVESDFEDNRQLQVSRLDSNSENTKTKNKKINGQQNNENDQQVIELTQVEKTKKTNICSVL
jgi:hypothetical protein